MTQMVLVTIYWIVISFAPLIVDWIVNEIRMQKNKRNDFHANKLLHRHLEMRRACLKHSHITQMPGQSWGGHLRATSTIGIAVLLAGVIGDDNKGLTAGAAAWWAAAAVWMAACLFIASVIETMACRGMYGNLLMMARIKRRFRKVQGGARYEVALTAMILRTKLDLEKGLLDYFGQNVLSQAKKEVP